jgi:hypothetical protein
VRVLRKALEAAIRARDELTRQTQRQRSPRAGRGVCERGERTRRRARRCRGALPASARDGRSRRGGADAQGVRRAHRTRGE